LRFAGGTPPRGKTIMLSVLMVSLAVSIVLGMWVIWRMTP
jgi:hypothetical protein